MWCLAWVLQIWNTVLMYLTYLRCPEYRKHIFSKGRRNSAIGYKWSLLIDHLFSSHQHWMRRLMIGSGSCGHHSIPAIISKQLECLTTSVQLKQSIAIFNFHCQVKSMGKTAASCSHVTLNLIAMCYSLNNWNCWCKLAWYMIFFTLQLHCLEMKLPVPIMVVNWRLFEYT